MRYYTGVGSRDTPQVVCDDMTEIAAFLRPYFFLRSGGAGGADSAFEDGAGDHKEIYLPKDGFNGRYHDDEVFFYMANYPDINNRAKKIAEKFHPVWNRLDYRSKQFHTRNVYQVLGKDLKSPSKFLICYTKGGLMKGGTATTLRIAKEYKVPIYNLGKMSKNDVLYFLSDKIRMNNE